MDAKPIKRKRGNPRSKILDERICVSMKKEEMDKIKYLATEKKITIAAFIRQCVLCDINQ
jgi:hypothetical protein